MPYYVRVLSTSSGCPRVRILEKALKKPRLGGKVHIDDGDDKLWTQLVFVKYIVLIKGCWFVQRSAVVRPEVEFTYPFRCVKQFGQHD